MAVALIHELYEYHHWANRHLLDIAAGLGDGATRDMGAHWRFPTLRGMFALVYGADLSWLRRWQGSSPLRLMGDGDFASIAALREQWDSLAREHGAVGKAVGAGE